MDTMTSTKTVAALCGALLVFLLAKWVAEGVYHTGGHGDSAGYVIAVEDSGGASDEPEVDFSQVMAEADPEKGAKVFKKCQACHKVEPGVNATGPSLYGVVGRQVASEAGFGYSDAMKAHGGEWTPEALNEFLHKPSAAAPGTAMSFAGLPKIGDRADVIAYLDSLDN